MSQAEITAILNLVAALLPIIERGAVTLVADVQLLLERVNASEDATHDQLLQAQDLMAQSDAAQDAAFAAYTKMASQADGG